jgi:hypothetical protein
LRTINLSNIERKKGFVLLVSPTVERKHRCIWVCVLRDQAALLGNENKKATIEIISKVKASLFKVDDHLQQLNPGITLLVSDLLRLKNTFSKHPT